MKPILFIITDFLIYTTPLFSQTLTDSTVNSINNDSLQTTKANTTINKQQLKSPEELTFEILGKDKAKESNVPSGVMAIIYFSYDNDQLDLLEIQKLNQVYLIYKENPKMQIELHGHTDSRGTEVYNKILSERRCHQVFNYLYKKGVAYENIKQFYYGESIPLAINEYSDGTENKRGMLLNRRVEIIAKETDQTTIELDKKEKLTYLLLSPKTEQVQTDENHPKPIPFVVKDKHPQGYWWWDLRE